MLHRMTIPAIVLRDYESRKVFARYRVGDQHPRMDDISIKIGTDDLKALLEDAERRAGMDRTTPGYFPNLKRAFSQFAEKARRLLRSEPGNETVGRIGKEAATGSDSVLDFSKEF